MEVARDSLSIIPVAVIGIIAEYLLYSEELERLTRLFKRYAKDKHGYMCNCVNIPLLENETDYDRQWIGIGLQCEGKTTEYSIQFGNSYGNYADRGGYTPVTLLELLPSRELTTVAGSSWNESSWSGCGSLLLRGKDQFLWNLVYAMSKC